MANETINKLNTILDSLENAGKDKRKIGKARRLIENGNLAEALKQIREINSGTAEKTIPNKKKEVQKRKVSKRKKIQEEENYDEKSKDELDEESSNDFDDEPEEDYTEDEEEFSNEYDGGSKDLDEEEEIEEINGDEIDNEDEIEDDDETDDEIEDSEDIEKDETNEANTEEEELENGDDEEDELDEEDEFGWEDGDKEEVVYKVEEKKHESIYPEELRNEELEKTYIGMLLNNPKLITKYYILFEECYFDDPSLLNIYKSILFTEGGKFTPEIAKKGFNFSVDNSETYKQKQDLRMEIAQKNLNPEKVYLELRKLCIIRKSYQEEPREEIQEQIIDIVNYELYDQMSADEVKAAIVQVSVTQKFKQAVLSEDLTEFLEKGENNLTNGLELPFPILSSVFKGIRKGETMAFAMPSNSGKSRFTIDVAAYTAFIHRKKVLIISNEMSEEKMKLCLITTVINNPEIQKLHGQKVSITEGELLEFKFRPSKGNSKIKTDENGYVLQEENETRAEFVERLKQVSDEFNKTIAITDWVNSQINNSIYFINITDHTNDELKKVIMNYYYKEKIEYVFYDTLKTDTANIGNGEEIKRTATILSNLAQNFNMFIFSTLQLTESATLPINLTVNDLAVSRTVKEVLDTLCLIKQIPRDNLSDYKYSLEEVDTKFFELKKYDDPDERYYACVVDKNRAGAKPKLLFNLNLAYNRWNELGYLFLK